MAERHRWLMLAVAYLSTLGFAFVFQAVSPLLSLIIGDLHISYSEAGLLMSLFSLPGIFLSIAIGVLADRYGVRPVAIASLGLMVSGSVVTTIGDSFLFLAAGRFIAGAGAVQMSYIIGPQIVAQWFSGKELGTAMGIYSTATPVGIIVCLNLLASIGTDYGWRAATLIPLSVAVLALVVFAIFYRPPSSGTARSRPAIENPFRVGWPIWIVGLIWALLNASVISFSTFAPDFFVAQGLSMAAAGFIVSSLLWESPLISPFVGYLMDRWHHEGLLIGVGCLGVAIGLVVILSPVLPPMLVIGFMGLLVTLPPPPVFALPAKVMDERMLGMGFGIVATCFNLGIFVGPYLVGLARDLTGSYESSFLIMAAYATVASCLPVWLGSARRRKSSAKAA
ncbi:MAG: MFS transporter [Chloroflexota bacterium]